MDNLKKCEKCGESLGASQYAREKIEGESAAQENGDLVCRNYPACDRAEKDT